MALHNRDSNAIEPRPTSPTGMSLDPPNIEAGLAEEKTSPSNQVNWDNEFDSLNPMNWSTSLKWRNLGIISVMSLAT